MGLLEKRATVETVVTVAGNCALPTTVTMAEYINVVDYLATVIAGNLPPSQDMLRWYSNSVQDCVPTVTTISDAVIQKNQKDKHPKDMESFQINGTGGGGWTCEESTKLFLPCDSNKLQSVYHGNVGNEHCDFIGIIAELNRQMKGAIGGNYTLEVTRKSKNVRKMINGRVLWSSIWKILAKEQGFLQQLRQIVAVTRTQVSEPIRYFPAGLAAGKLAAEIAGDVGTWEQMDKVLQGLIDQYDLQGDNNPGGKSIKLTWTLNAANKKRAAALALARSDEESCPVGIPPKLSIMVKLVKRDLLGGWTDAPVICTEQGLVYGPEGYYADTDPEYPTSLGPFDLRQAPYTDCYYEGPALIN
ncbi:hypothetical protein BDV12DRAFT_201318 [Aspergillus spectabilis]